MAFNFTKFALKNLISRQYGPFYIADILTNHKAGNVLLLFPNLWIPLSNFKNRHLVHLPVAVLDADFISSHSCLLHSFFLLQLHLLHSFFVAVSLVFTFKSKCAKSQSLIDFHLSLIIWLVFIKIDFRRKISRFKIRKIHKNKISIKIKCLYLEYKNKQFWWKLRRSPVLWFMNGSIDNWFLQIDKF